MSKKKPFSANTGWMSFRVTSRVALGLTTLTLLLLNIALWLGMLPDQTGNILQERKFLVESMAVTYSGLIQMNNAGLIQMNNQDQIRQILEETIRRTPWALSAGIRDKDGHLVVAVGDHEAQWTNRTGEQSTDSQMKVPLMLNNTPWGEIELRFTPINSDDIWSFFQNNITRFFAFMLVGSLLVYSGFVWFMLRSVLTMTTSDAIPKRIRDMLNTLAEGILILDKQLHIVLANQAFANLLGSAPAEVEGRAMSQLPWIKPKDKEDAVYPWEQSAITGETYTAGALGLQGQNLPQSFSINTTPITGIDGSYRGVMVTFDNMTKIEKKNNQLKRLTERLGKSRTEIKKQNTKLEFLATRDPMTECYNRRALFEHFESLWAAAQRYNQQLCCIMVDIDHFKSVNDNHGHAMGDEVIKHLAKLMEENRRATDIVGRYGGEEFVILLPHVNIDEANIAAERLRQSVEKTPCGELRITASMGVSSFNFGAKDINELLHQADQGLYAAKHGGRNRVCRWDQLSDKERNVATESAQGKKSEKKDAAPKVTEPSADMAPPLPAPEPPPKVANM